MLSEKLKEVRERNDLTQQELSKIINVKRSTYSLWEINKNVIPLKYLIDISKTFNINLDYLAGLSDIYISAKNVDKINKITLGIKLKEARKDINFSQEKLADLLNTTHSVISAYESGKTNIQTLFLIEIARISNKSLYWFFE